MWCGQKGKKRKKDDESPCQIREFCGSSVRKKNLPAVQQTQVQLLGREDPLEKEIQPTPVFLPGKSRGHRSLAGYSPWCCKSQT